MANLKTVEGKLRKRKRNHSLLEESIGSNFESSNPIIKVIGGLPMDSSEECNVLKDVLFDYSRRVFTNIVGPSIVGDYWSLEFWKYICADYNQRAYLRGLQSRTEDDIYTGGKILQREYCMLRATATVDVKLDKIFKPCEDCNLRVVFFPTSEIAGMNYHSNHVFTNSELITARSVLLDYSYNNFQIQRGDYYSASFWNTLADVCNMRVVTQSELFDGGKMLMAGRKLQRTFNTQRVNGAISHDLKQIFERCEDCKRRIIVFPSSLFPQCDTSCLTPSTMRSLRSENGTGNANRASTSCGTGCDEVLDFQKKLNDLVIRELINIDEMIAFVNFIIQNPIFRGLWTPLPIAMQLDFIRKVIQ